jgi:hypothetical protein
VAKLSGQDRGFRPFGSLGYTPSLESSLSQRGGFCLPISVSVPMTDCYDRLEVALSALMVVSVFYLSFNLAERAPNQNRIAFVNSCRLKPLEARRAEHVFSRRLYVNACNRL